MLSNRLVNATGTPRRTPASSRLYPNPLMEHSREHETMRIDLGRFNLYLPPELILMASNGTLPNCGSKLRVLPGAKNLCDLRANFQMSWRKTASRLLYTRLATASIESLTSFMVTLVCDTMTTKAQWCAKPAMV